VLGAHPGSADDLILNVQGDEPEIEPDFLDRLGARMQAAPTCPMGTLACPLPESVDPDDPNNVKVVVNRAGRALYFSRARIPYPRADVSVAERIGPLLHLGVYAYRRAFLQQFAAWSPSALEWTERLEQLRALDHGVSIAVEVVPRAAPGIDTPEEYAAFVKRWQG
jgi:3-deoxy-manno-octulosonate cytidylyltransferase (CMP-KDO synthetase)